MSAGKTVPALFVQLGAVENVQNLERFRSLRVIFVGRSEKNRSIAIDYIARGDGQLPAVLAVHKRQIHKGTAVERLLLVGDAIDQTKLTRDIVVCIHQHGKDELVLVAHEKGLLLGL